MPDISKITLPSGTTYDIKDSVAREAISGGVSFVVAWDGNSTPVVADIPAGVTVTYNGTTYTGTLSAEDATPGAFYLVKSATTTTGSPSDSYDEYVPVGTSGSKTWEKIGDTQVDLSDVVTGVTLNKQTDTVIGTDATFTITQPTVALSTGATAGTGVISVATGVTPTTKYLSAGASGANTAWNNKDQKSAITALGTPSTESAVKSVSPSTGNLVTTSVTGVTSSTTTASKATVGTATSQTTATGGGTSSTTNTDWLKGVSVSNETLVIGAATLNTQTTSIPNITFSDITVPVKASSATTVATGAVSNSGTGDAVVTDVAVGDTFNAVTGYSSPTTANVIGTSSTFTITQPTVTLTANAGTGTGRITYVESATADTTNIKATASGANTAWNNKDSVTALTNSTTITVTKGA